jgi:NDP-sugar pyrophosphorylase family protein
MKVFVGNRINAGIYFFNASILDRIQVQHSTVRH